MKGKYHKVIIELEFDTFKPTEDDIFKYIKDLYEDNSLGYTMLNSKGKVVDDEGNEIDKVETILPMKG